MNVVNKATSFGGFILSVKLTVAEEFEKMMKAKPSTIEVIEVPNEGAVKLLGKYVEIRCGNYHYAGKLVGVNDKCVELDEAHTIFSSGAYTTKKYDDAQPHVNPELLVYFTFVESILPIPASRLGK